MYYFYLMYRNKQSVSSHKLSPKLYQSEEVSLIIKNLIEPKLHLFKRQLQQKQRIIRQLNQRLNLNDIRITELSKELQKIKEIQYNHRAQTIDITNEILNSKFKQNQEIMSKQINKIRQIMRYLPEKKNEVIEKNIELMKENVNQVIEQAKKRNNSYWLNIKQVLSKLHNRIGIIQQKFTQLGQFVLKTKQTIELGPEIKKSKNFLRNFKQLRSSIINIENNYKELLQMQNFFKDKCNKRKEDIVSLDYSKSPYQGYYKNKPQYQQSYQYSNQQSQKTQIRRPLPSPIKKPQQSSIVSINSDNPLHSTTLINLSMQNRKEMSSNLQSRLMQIAEIKNISLPLKGYLDQINYLKNCEGNYIFDLKGNMFKMSSQEFDHLCNEGILKKQNRDDSRLSKLKNK